jgi:hypothetical protein
MQNNYGLRLLCGCKIIMDKLIEKMRMAITDIGEKDKFASILIPDYLKSDKMKASDNASAPIGDLCKEVRSAAIKYAGTSQKSTIDRPKSNRCEMMRKMENGSPNEVAKEYINFSRLTEILDEVDVLVQQHASLFEWVDGPLVGAMRKGNLFLFDEMSLAEDAVLERQNTVLEPSRTLVLAEKGSDLSLDEVSSDSTEAKADDDHESWR